MSNQKILILSPNLHLVGGVSNYVKLTLSYFKLKNIEVSCMFIGRKYVDENIFSVFFRSIYQLIVYRLSLYQLKPEIVHTHPSMVRNSFIRDITFRLFTPKSIRFFTTFHGWNEDYFTTIKKSKLYTLFRKSMIDREKIFLLANKFIESLKNFGIPHNKLVKTTTMVPISKSDLIINTNKKSQVLFCSRITKDKGPHHFINIIDAVVSNHPNVNFVMIGDGPYLEKCIELQKNISNPSKLEIKGFVDNNRKYQIFNESSIFVLPSRHGEGLPTVILEAMLSGQIIITTNVGGILDVIDSSSGYLIDYDNISNQELSFEINKYFLDKNLKSDISKSNKYKAISHFSVQSVSKKIYDYY